MTIEAKKKVMTATMKGATKPKLSADQLATTPAKIAIKPLPQVAHENVCESKEGSNSVY